MYFSKKFIKYKYLFLKKFIMLKKIIITIILLFSIVWFSLWESVNFSLKDVSVKSKNILELTFTKQLKWSEFLNDSFKLVDSSKNELLIKNVKIFDKNKVEIVLDEDMKTESLYKITALELLDIDWNSIKQWYDASLEFTTPKKFEEVKTKEELELIRLEQEKKRLEQEKAERLKKQKELEQKKINDEIEKQKKLQEKLEKEKRLQEEKKKEQEKKLEAEKKKENILEKIKQKNKEIREKNKNKTWEEVNNWISGWVAKNSWDNTIVVDELPTSWPAENILLILSFLLGIGLFLKKRV
jgi:outer membrane biosynthesis protein TonB